MAKSDGGLTPVQEQGLAFIERVQSYDQAIADALGQITVQNETHALTVKSLEELRRAANMPYREQVEKAQKQRRRKWQVAYDDLRTLSEVGELSQEEEVFAWAYLGPEPVEYQEDEDAIFDISRAERAVEQFARIESGTPLIVNNRGYYDHAGSIKDVNLSWKDHFNQERVIRLQLHGRIPETILLTPAELANQERIILGAENVDEQLKEIGFLPDEDHEVVLEVLRGLLLAVPGLKEGQKIKRGIFAGAVAKAEGRDATSNPEYLSTLYEADSNAFTKVERTLVNNHRLEFANIVEDIATMRAYIIKEASSPDKQLDHRQYAQLYAEIAARLASYVKRK